MLRFHAAKIAVAVLLALFLYPVLSAQTSRPQPKPPPCRTRRSVVPTFARKANRFYPASKFFRGQM